MSKDRIGWPVQEIDVQAIMDEGQRAYQAHTNRPGTEDPMHVDGRTDALVTIDAEWTESCVDPRDNREWTIRRSSDGRETERTSDDGWRWVGYGSPEETLFQRVGDSDKWVSRAPEPEPDANDSKAEEMQDDQAEPEPDANDSKAEEMQDRRQHPTIARVNPTIARVKRWGGQVVGHSIVGEEGFTKKIKSNEEEIRVLSSEEPTILTAVHDIRGGSAKTTTNLAMALAAGNYTDGKNVWTFDLDNGGTVDKRLMLRKYYSALDLARYLLDNEQVDLSYINSRMDPTQNIRAITAAKRRLVREEAEVLVQKALTTLGIEVGCFDMGNDPLEEDYVAAILNGVHVIVFPANAAPDMDLSLPTLGENMYELSKSPQLANKVRHGVIVINNMPWKDEVEGHLKAIDTKIREQSLIDEGKEIRLEDIFEGEVVGIPHNKQLAKNRVYDYERWSLPLVEGSQRTLIAALKSKKKLHSIQMEAEKNAA